MPMKDGRWTSSRATRTNRIKRYVSLAIIMLAFLAALDQWGFRATSYAGLWGGQERASQSQRSEQERGAIGQRPTQEQMPIVQKAEESEPAADQTATSADCT